MGPPKLQAVIPVIVVSPKRLLIDGLLELKDGILNKRGKRRNRQKIVGFVAFHTMLQILRFTLLQTKVEAEQLVSALSLDLSQVKMV